MLRSLFNKLLKIKIIINLCKYHKNNVLTAKSLIIQLSGGSRILLESFLGST